MALSAVLVLLVPHAWAQLLALLLGGIVGLLALTPPDHEPLQSNRLVVPLSRSAGLGFLGLLLLLLLALPWLSDADRPLVMQQLSAFLRTGALVFGGGHVVMPLLEHSLVPRVGSDWISFWWAMARRKLFQVQCSALRHSLVSICRMVFMASLAL
jgi:chromate transporter